MPGESSEPAVRLRDGLQELFVLVRRPGYRTLQAYADRDGRALPPSTLSDLLNRPAVPRWNTVDAFVRACGRHAHAQQIEVPGELLDLDRWQQIHQAAQNASAAPAHTGPSHGRGELTRRPAVVPAQLPPGPPAFTGRAHQLVELDDLLSGTGPGAVVISAVSGTAGVGKTALAVHWAHRVAGQFPDGQLYVNLRGFDPDGRSTAPEQVLLDFLRALGAAPEQVPERLEARAALYRSMLAGKRVLVILDNARNAEQVRPLLPGAPTCLALVTSRDQLTALAAAEGARPVRVDLLSTGEARQLLARRLGERRVAAEPHAVERIITACARLPLALSIAAARAQQSGFPLRVLADELATTGGPWSTLNAGDLATQVCAVFSWSYTTLSTPAARMFRLLGLSHGPDISTGAAASLAGTPVPQARLLLGELTGGSLLLEHAPGRYTMHDLLRAYATDLARAHEPEHEREAATARLLDYYIHTADAAARCISRVYAASPFPLAPAAPGARPEQMHGFGAARRWLNAELDVLLAMVRYTSDTRLDRQLCQLGWAMRQFLDISAHWYDLATLGQAVQDAGTRLGNPVVAGFGFRLVARADVRLGRCDDARVHLDRALVLYAHAGDDSGLGDTHNDLAYLCELRGDPHRALEHAQRSLVLMRAGGDLRGQAHALNSIGHMHTLMGAYGPAIDHCQQALTLAQHIGERRAEGDIWASLGHAHRGAGSYPHAADSYLHAVALADSIGDRYKQATFITYLADMHLSTGERCAARNAYRQALDLLTDLDHPDARKVRARLHDSESMALG